jgi:hypothetical protein
MSHGIWGLTAECCCECPEWLDDFNRADSSNLGPNWEEIAGDPDDQDIYSNTLRQLHVGNRAKFTVAPPQSWILTVTLKDLSDGDVHCALIDWLNDGTDPGNYHYVEFRAVVDDTGANRCWLRLRQCLGGVHSTLVLVDANGHQSLAEIEYYLSFLHEGDDLNLVICASGPVGSPPAPPGEDTSLLTAWIDGGPGKPGWDSLAFWQCVGHFHHLVGDRRIVLENGADQAIRWDDFDLKEHGAGNPKCEDCWCSCEGWCLAHTLHATFSDIEGAPRLDGVTVPLRARYNSRPALPYGTPWKPDEYPADDPPIDERPTCQIDYPPQTGHWGMEFICKLEATYDQPAFQLILLLGPYGGSPCGAQLVNKVSSAPTDPGSSIVCDPLTVTFEFDFYSEPEVYYHLFNTVAESVPPYTYRRHFTVTITL